MKIRWPVVIILIMALALALAGGMTMLWRLFIFMALLLAGSYFWLKIQTRGIKGRLDKAPQFSRVGEYFEETFTVSNTSRLPALVIESKEFTDLPGYRNETRFSLLSQGSHTWKTRGLCRRRGQYRTGSLRTRIYDPLGVFYLKRELTDVKYVNVLPPAIDLPYFQLLPRREPGLSTRRWFAGEPGHNASRVREYTSGDSLRHIHWHSTAHTGQLMVKEFDPDLTRTYYFSDVWIILDMHHEAAWGEGEETTAEYGITIAASLVEKFLEEGKKVGFMASGDQSYLFPPANNPQHEQNINRALVLLQPRGEVHLDNLIISQEERIDPGAAVIVITPADFSRLNLPVRRLLNRGNALTAVLLDAASFGGKTAAADTAHSLSAAGVNVYTVRQGEKISQSLDVRRLFGAAPFTGALNK